MPYGFTVPRKRTWGNWYGKRVEWSPLWAGSLVIVGVLGSGGCRDRFPCGVPNENDGTVANTCDQKGEICLCAENRCATRVSSDVCPSRYRYSFSDPDNGDGDCVDGVKIEKYPILRTPQEGGGFCPGMGNRALACGVPGGTDCRENEACICATNRCAMLDPTCQGEETDQGEETGQYRYVDDLECVSARNAVRGSVLFPPETAADGEIQLLCPGYDPLLSPCGVRQTSGGVRTCGADERCVCAEQAYRCATYDDRCEGSGYVWTESGECVLGLTREQVELAELQVDELGYCPGWNPGVDVAGASESGVSDEGTSEETTSGGGNSGGSSTTSGS